MAGIGSGKVVRSGPQDRVFVFFSDHGSPGVLGMPSGESRRHLFLFSHCTYCSWPVNCSLVDHKMLAYI